jgi:DNA polymerase III subunit gamma/tau
MMSEKEPNRNPADSSADSGYTVVARRYRPKSFTELVGQENVAQALTTAIRTGRIGHAYLFTGARGVGKTSTARIFAKALNASGGPSADPDGESDIAKAIDAGEDMDVLEIDGASNRGIEEIRQLRANVNVRPSRSRFKIYIIDEVHMLTTAAFNALLKTLEEPPEHVKFIFCTTDPEKIPITVLSRCQRFDFPPVKKESIQERLRFICQEEGFQADDEALALIARRAAGSMRDSQSLLEQILSFSEGKVSVESVQELLGTADDSSLWDIVERFIAHDAVGVLQAIERSVGQGVEPGQFAEQLLGYMRDSLTQAVGAPADLLRHVHSLAPEQLSEQAARWGIQSLIAAMQILDESLVRMRHSMHGRTLLEMTLVQIAQLHRLEDLFGLSNAVPASAAAPNTSSAPSPAVPTNTVGEQKKNVEPIAERPKAVTAVEMQTLKPETVAASQMHPSVSAPHPRPVPATQSMVAAVAAPVANSTHANQATAVAEAPRTQVGEGAVVSQEAGAIWDAVAGRLQGLIADFALLRVDATWLDADCLCVSFEKRNQHAIDHLQRPDRKVLVERELLQVLGRASKLQFQAVADRASKTPEAKSPSDPNMMMQRNQRLRQVAENPLIKSLVDTLGGELLRVDPPSTPKMHLDQKG